MRGWVGVGGWLAGWRAVPGKSALSTWPCHCKPAIQSQFKKLGHNAALLAACLVVHSLLEQIVLIPYVEELEDLGRSAHGLRERHRRGRKLADADDDLYLVALERCEATQLKVAERDQPEANAARHLPSKSAHEGGVTAAHS